MSQWFDITHGTLCQLLKDYRYFNFFILYTIPFPYKKKQTRKILTWVNGEHLHHISRTGRRVAHNTDADYHPIQVASYSRCMNETAHKTCEWNLDNKRLSWQKAIVYKFNGSIVERLGAAQEQTVGPLNRTFFCIPLCEFLLRSNAEVTSVALVVVFCLSSFVIYWIMVSMGKIL